jgi:hypothetical protein
MLNILNLIFKFGGFFRNLKFDPVLHEKTTTDLIVNGIAILRLKTRD